MEAAVASRRIRLSIGGEWLEGCAGDPVPLVSPATGEEIALVEQGTREDVGSAVAAAERALQPLARMTAFERAALCHAVADRLLARRDEVARDIAAEQGKPYQTQAIPEVEVAAGMFRDAAECAKRLDTLVHQTSDPAKRVLTIRQPRGVYGIITPWNYPLAIPSEYLSAGLATGNAMVWKPSEWTPLSAGHPGIVAIGLTGSSRTGDVVARRAAGKPMLLELGGNGPTIVFDDADLEHASHRTAVGSFENSGQICNSTERILVHRRVHDDFVAGLVEEARKVRLGSPFAEGTTMGPLANEPTAAKMDEHVADAVERGAEILVGGARGDGFPTRLYYLPTVIDRVRPGMKLDLEETFGPVAPVMAFADEDEALAWANACPLGLNGSVFTRDVARAIRVAERLQTGTVMVNETSAYWQPHTPAGGYTGKRSGIGRIGGVYTLLEMTQVKTIVIDVGERAP